MKIEAEFIDADYDDLPADYEDSRITAARELPGANFSSVYGAAIHRAARQELSSNSKRFGWSERDEDAYWPTALSRAMSLEAISGRMRGVEGTPTEAEMEIAEERSAHFLNAWKVMTGNDMYGGRLSGHERLELASGVPEVFRAGARELRDTGVTHFAESAIKLGREMLNGERTRRDANRGRVPGAAAGRARVKQRQIGD